MMMRKKNKGRAVGFAILVVVVVRRGC